MLSIKPLFGYAESPKIQSNPKSPERSHKKGSNHYNVKQTHLHVNHLQGYNAKSSHLELLESDTWCDECAYGHCTGLFGFLIAYRSDVFSCQLRTENESYHALLAKQMHQQKHLNHQQMDGRKAHSNSPVMRWGASYDKIFCTVGFHAFQIVFVNQTTYLDKISNQRENK
jgi:hypothetical protein